MGCIGNNHFSCAHVMVCIPMELLEHMRETTLTQRLLLTFVFCIYTAVPHNPLDLDCHVVITEGWESVSWA